jgi:lipopolysaccharide transport system ATP-binding protein
MSNTIIKVEDLGKLYRLGEIGTGTISHDINRWWARVRGKEDPFAKIGESNDRTAKGNSEYVWALKDINFEVNQGEVLGIIGRNGAGKSTLLKILSKVTTPSTGRIKVKGRIASLLEVGTGFHPELTGRENIFLNGAILGMTKEEIRKKFDEIVDFAGVERYIDTPVKRYSSGMYVRLAFAVAAFLEPEILIIDEVLAVGDAEFQKKCLGRMKDVSVNDGRTVLFVSHNMGAVASLCNRACYFEEGKKVLDSSVNDCVNLYFNRKESGSINQNFVVDDSEFKLLEVYLEKQNNDNIFFVNQPIKFKYTYQVKKDVHGLRVGFDLIEKKSGNILFRSFHDDANKEASFFKAGYYESIGIIPANLLMDGSYDLQIKIGIHNQRWIVDDQIELSLQTTNVHALNSNYNDTRPGFLMPKIEWQTKNV